MQRERSLAGGRLSFDDAAAVMGEIMDGSPTSAQFGAFVAALSVRGETSEEIAGMATVMRARARRVDAGGESRRHVRHWRGRAKHLQHLHGGGVRGGGRGRQGRQARQSRGDESVRQRRRARSAGREDRSAAGGGCRVHPSRGRGVHVCPDLSSGHEVRRGLSGARSASGRCSTCWARSPIRPVRNARFSE